MRGGAYVAMLLLVDCTSTAGSGIGQPSGDASTGSDGPDDASHGDGGKGSACVPGQQVACACAGGTSGVQVCNVDGSGLGPCTGCAGSSGVDGGGCVPLTKSQVCASSSYCGAHEDGCGGTIDCGTCSGKEECSCYGGGAGVCCTPFQNCEYGNGIKLCGTTQDGCGCTVTCPACANGPCILWGAYNICQCDDGPC